MCRRGWIPGICLTLLPLTSQAELLLFVDGVPGATTTKNYAGWFKAESLSWSMQSPDGTKSRALHVVVRASAGTATLAQASAMGSVFRRIAIDQLVSSPDGLLLVARVTCEEAVVKSFVSSSGQSDSQVSLEIQCGKQTWENYDYNIATRAVSATGKGTWNFKTNTP